MLCALKIEFAAMVRTPESFLDVRLRATSMLALLILYLLGTAKPSRERP